MAYLSTGETSAITHVSVILYISMYIRNKFVLNLWSSKLSDFTLWIIYVYMYVCIYNFLWIILILSLWSELLEVRWQSLAN